jgi:2-C-methyl-D-erythritol 2,4-cyclodiphosphate synthase
VVLPGTRAQQKVSVRCGIGYDLHRLEAGRKLIIGGLEVPFDKGPVGHSDGDVVAHALCDALLGAAGLGDIGTHFPDTDAKWKGADSMQFLEHVARLLSEKKFAIEHVDAVVILERPKLGAHFPKMREALAKALGVTADRIHLKAKTNEGVDAVGRGEAIAAYVVATLETI